MGHRRILRAAVVLIILGHCSLFLLFYQVEETIKLQESCGNIIYNFSVPRVANTTIKNIERTEDDGVTLEDIFISVKTSKHFQYTRLPIIWKTWFQLAKQQTWFFTDINNGLQQNQTDGHIVNTNCSASHQVLDLCCKTSVEYDHFIDSGLKWFCHFDDDIYVNIPQLVYMLQKYDYKENWYLGRTSFKEPYEIYSKRTYKPMCSFRFATGAGYCISSGLALRMLPVAGGGGFSRICEEMRLPDDVVMGFIIEKLMKTNLTEVLEFHSHLEKLKLLDLETFRHQISFSFVEHEDGWNVVNVPGFDKRFDPTRILSLHCFLFPHFKYCLKIP